MKTETMQSKFELKQIFSILIALMFVTTGILNIFLVHVVPGIFYLVIALIYLPRTNQLINNQFGFNIPFAAKIVFGLLILWATLAVGDLTEIFGL